ncbi:MAG: response regulator [Candidatus Methylomirabilales bacterium]
MGKHVLYVDDDVNLRRFVKGLLERHGYQVTIAGTGEAGLEVARAHPPDLIMLDILLPGLNGFEICQQLRGDEGLRGIPVLMLTQMDDPKLNERAFAAGAQMCMTKPLQADRLLSAVQMVLKSAAQKRQQAEKQRKPG